MSGSYPQRRFALPPGAVELVLVRHGASAAALPDEPFGLLDGHSDPPLAREGVEQAREVCERLSGELLSGVFVTPLRRTQETAAPLGRETVVVPELREVLLGEWEGGEFRIRAAHGDPLFLRVLEEERWDLIPGAETNDEFAERVRHGAERIIADSEPGSSVACFVHGGVIGELCRQATSSRPFAFVHADNCSITRIVAFPDGRWLLRSFNDTSHLRS